MLASSCHPQRHILRVKHKDTCCWVGQPVDARPHKHRQLRQCQQPHYSSNTYALLRTAELVAKPAPAMTSGPPLDTDTIAAIVTGKLLVDLFQL